MGIRVHLPELSHWKAQVKCQLGCPVHTDAGRYVQLIAENRDEDAYLVARAPNPFASVCGRVCAAPCEDACRRGSIDAPVAIRALKRYVTEQYGVESMKPDTQDRLREEGTSEGNRYAGHLPVVRRTDRRRLPRWTARKRQRRRHWRRPGGPGRRARPRAARLRRDGVRSQRRAGRHDAVRHPGIPAAAHAPSRGNRQDPRPRRDAQAGRRPEPELRALAPSRGRVRIGLPLGRRVARP